MNHCTHSVFPYFLDHFGFDDVFMCVLQTYMISKIMLLVKVPLLCFFELPFMQSVTLLFVEINNTFSTCRHMQMLGPFGVFRQLDNKEQNIFLNSEEVKQGCCLSQTLFNICINELADQRVQDYNSLQIFTVCRRLTNSV